jgi:hypothetical protein
MQVINPRAKDGLTTFGTAAAFEGVAPWVPVVETAWGVDGVFVAVLIVDAADGFDAADGTRGVTDAGNTVVAESVAAAIERYVSKAGRTTHPPSFLEEIKRLSTDFKERTGCCQNISS